MTAANLSIGDVALNLGGSTFYVLSKNLTEEGVELEGIETSENGTETIKKITIFGGAMVVLKDSHFTLEAEGEAGFEKGELIIIVSRGKWSKIGKKEEQAFRYEVTTWDGSQKRTTWLWCSIESTLLALTVSLKEIKDKINF